VRLDSGQELTVPAEALAGRAGRVAVGIRPEKIRVGPGGENSLQGKVFERAYVGVSTQYVVETEAGRLTLYVQNAGPGAANAAPGDGIALSWSSDSAFVVDAPEEEST
jgi:spermidine/putrescine transport system ATP-binding protein